MEDFVFFSRAKQFNKFMLRFGCNQIYLKTTSGSSCNVVGDPKSGQSAPLRRKSFEVLSHSGRAATTLLDMLFGHIISGDRCMFVFKTKSTIAAAPSSEMEGHILDHQINVRFNHGELEVFTCLQVGMLPPDMIATLFTQ